MKPVARMALLMLILCLSLPALAMSLEQAKTELDAAKNQGLVGETPTGYLSVVRPDARAQEIVEAINRARREEYVRIAEKHDIAVAKVETVAGRKAMEKTPSGLYIEVDGEWVRK